MAEKERPLYTLYKGLKANNFDVPDNYDSFERTLTEAGNGGANSRHTLYNSLKEQNFDVPDTYERFYSNLFTPVNKNTSRALGGAVPMADADKARFSAGAAAISAQAGQVMRRAKNTQRADKLKQQQKKQRNDFGRVDLGTRKTPYGTDNAVKDDFGVDPVTGKVGTYVTSSGEEIGNEFDAGQQQQAEDKFNNAYNAAVDSGAIPSAFDVVDKDGNYDLYENVGKNGTHVTEQGIQNQLDAKINYANERLADIKAKIAEIDSKNGNPLLSYQASIGGGSGASEERRQLGLAKTQVEAELRSLDAVKKQPDRNFLQNGWQGFSDTALTAKTWDFGLNDFALMAQMEHIKTKIDNNVPLTNEEKRLAQSKVGADAAAALADKEMGKAYRWSGIAGQSVPFMFDFLLTGGFGGLTHAAGKAAVKYAAKKGMGAFGKNVLKYTGVTAANIVGSYAMAGTEQAFKTGADIMNRHMGTLYQDEDGNYKFGTFDDNGNLIHDGGEGFGTALYKGLTAAMLENYTEKVFRHTHFKRATSKAFANHFPKFASFLATKGAPKWMKRLGIDGLGEEIMEEEINIPLNALLVGDNKLSDLGDLQQQSDIIFGIGLSVGAMYALNSAPRGAAKIYNSAQYYKFKNAMGNVDSRLQTMMGDRWDAWKDKIDNTPNEKMGALVNEVLQQKQSGSLDEEEINTIGDYISNLAKVRGYNLAKTTEVQAKEETGEETTPEDEQQQEQEQAYAEGQDAEGEEKHEIQQQTAETESWLASLLGVSEDQLDSVDLDNMLGENDELDLAIYDYQNAQAKYQGVMDNAQSKIDAAEQNAIAEVRRRTDTSRGTVRNATIKSSSNDLNGGEDYGVFIVSGNLAQNEDGTINTTDSDQMILYFDPLTGKIESGDATRFASIGEEVDADLFAQQTVELAKQDALSGVVRDIDGIVGEGSQFTVTDNQGRQHVYDVLADNGDGTASISIDGNVMENVFPSFKELQKMKDDSDKQRIANSVVTKKAELEKRLAEEEQKKQEAEDKVKTIDWSQLIDPNGTITTATIEGEEDKLGFVVGYTPSGKLRIAYLNEDGTIEKQKGLVAPGKVLQGEPMSVDEYKNVMGDWFVEQSSNSDLGDGVSTKEVENSGLMDGTPIGENESVATPVSDEEADTIISDMSNRAEPAADIPLTPENWVKEFGEDGTVQTPIGNVKMGENQLAKLFLKGREAQLGMIKPTLTNPDAIIEIESGGKEGEEVERGTKLLFVKTFLNKNGKKVHYFTSVTVRKEGMEVSVSNHIETEKRIRRFLKEGKLLYRVYGGAQTEQTQPSASVTTSQDGIAGSSEGKDNKNPSNGNEEKQTLTFGDGTPVPMLEDGNPDFSKMTAGQTAELYDAQFGEDADQILSSSVADAKKSLDKAKSKPIKGKNFLEQKASKDANDKAVAEAQAAYDNAKSVSNAYQEMLIDRSLGTVEGRQTILDKAKRKFDRLKNTDEWKDNQQPLWDETVGKVLHRLYDNTSVDVFDLEPRTVEEYVSSNLAPFSLNYEGSDTAKGVKQETGLKRKDFAKNHVLAAEGKGQTVDSFVHKLWMNRPPQLENVTDQDIRNAVIGLITGNMNAYDMRHVIENNRIAEAEKEIEDEQTAAENAAYQEEQEKKTEEVAASSAENNTPIEEVPEEEATPTDSEEQQNEQQPKEQSPEDDADNMPFGEQLSESDLPFSPNEENKVVGSKERKEMVDKNKVTVDHVSEAFIPKKLQRGIARIAKMMPKVNGKPLTVQYLYSADADGWFDRDTNTLYLALDSSKALQMVFGHEMTHAIKSMNTSSYDELKGLMKEFLGEDFDKAVDATEQFYNAHGVTYPNREDYEEEVIADGIGAIINDLNLTKGIALRMSHPLLAAFHNILMKIRLAFRLSDDGTYERLTHAVKVIEKAYVDTMKMDAANVENTTGEQGTAFSIRQKPDPEKTIKCYKLMRLGEDGKLYPLFIDAKAPTELGIWYDGDSPNLEQLKGLPSGVHLVDNETGKVTSFEDWYNEHTDLYKKGNGNITKMGKLPSKEAINWATLHNARFMYIEDTKRGQNRFGGEARKYWNLGINGSGTVSTFSMRPGWHAGSLPTMRQIGKGKDKNLRDDNFVWVEGEISADIDYNEEAQKNPDKDIPNRIPEDGYYLKATNANKTASQADRVGWYVAGAFKANRIMGDAEARKVIDDWNANHPDLPVEYDYERESGLTFNADTMRLEDKDGNPSPKFSLKVYHGSGADFDEFDFDHMGEGAGSQAFGWGGYVTSSKNIGKSYAQSGMQTRTVMVKNNGKWFEFSEGDPMFKVVDEAMYLIKSEGLRGARNFANRWKEDADTEEVRQQWAKVADLLDNHTKVDFKSRYPSHLYEVEIPDDNGKNYLDWSEKVPSDVLAKIGGVLDERGIMMSDATTNGDVKASEYLAKYKDDWDGNTLYTELVSDLGGYKEASKLLSDVGLTGIKYPAGTIMGGAKKGDTNYVIFKPEDMNIASHTKFSIRTYHGSHASFDKFDHSFMGSGEGAQAYGWGTYVSEVEGIAKAYAKQNAKKNAPSRLMYQGKPMTYKTPTVIYQVALDMDRNNISAKEAISKVIDADEKKLASVSNAPFGQLRAKQYKKELDILKGLNPSDFKINEDYDTVAQNLADVKSGLSLLENELKDAKTYVNMYQSRLDEAKEELAKAKGSGTGLGVDMYEADVEYYSRQVEKYKQTAKVKESDIKDVKAKVDALQKQLDSMEKPRNLYTVEIPDDTGDNYIDWDGGLSENAALNIAKGLVAKNIDAAIDMFEKYGNFIVRDEVKTLHDRKGEIKKDKLSEKLGKAMSEFRGGAIYEDLSNVLGGQKAASLVLKDAGFDGVKVIAQRNSGGNKNGRMNYVIFDEDNAKIVNHTKFSLRGENFSSRLKTAISETDINPSEAQKQSGNYKKGHIKFGGYDFTIENPKGSERKGVDEDGKEWSVKMHDTYGYIRGKIGKDGDHLDMFINDSADLDNWNGNVYVVDQVKDDGSFDEHKVMYGYNSEADAKNAYLANYSKGWKGLGNITGVDKETFDKWIQSSDRKTKPFADYSMIRNADSDARFSLRDEEYLKAVEDGDMEKAQKMVNEAAEKAGYISGSDYQGTSAFNGSAPWGNGYFLTKEERKEAWDNGDFEGESTLGDYINDGIDGGNLEELTNSASYRAADNMRKKAILNVRNAIQDKAKTIKMYRSVPSSVKEGSFRNGDWITPSKDYAKDNAKIHGWGDNYRIIEQEVPVDEVWFDGNDIAEWGYGREEDYANDTDFAYKNTKHNKKLLDAVTYYDDNGNVIPLSKRFNDADSDIRFSLAGLSGAANADKAEGVITRLANFNIALKMVKDKKDAKAIKMATGWEKGADGKWRYEMPDAKVYEYIELGDGTKVKRYDEDMLWTFGKLGDVVDAPEIFKAYPQLKDVDLDTDSMTGENPSNGEYNPNTKTITIHASELKYLNSLLNHEIQHAIQYIEGFAKGGSPSEFTDSYVPYALFDKLVRNRFGNADYGTLSGIIQDKTPEYSAFKKNLGVEWDGFFKNEKANLKYQKESDYMKSYHKFVDEGKKGSAFTQYWKLAGEVEARNVEKRMGMSAEERRNSLAEETEDIPRGEQSVRFSLKDPGKTMFGMHNISVDKLRKAIKQGGFAAPSMGVVDSKNGVYSDYGEITLIPKAEKLDKRKGKNAGTFTADAWTPTYPQVTMRLTKEGKEKLYTDTLLNDNIPKEIGKNLLNRWESYINTGTSQPSEFAWQYMFEKGMNPKVNYSKSAYPKSISNKVMEITDNGVKRRNELTKEENGELIKLYNAYLEKKGEGLDDNAVKEIIDYLEEWKENEKVDAFKQSLQRKIDYFKEYGGDINKAQDWAWQDVIPAAKSDGKVNHAMTLYYATIKADSDKKMQSDLQKWFDDKLKEYGMEEYLYNGETASGKPRYVPNTVENAVKIMKKQGLAGGYNDFAPGVGAFIAKYAPTANTLAAMKKNKDKLIPSGDERHKEVRDMILDEYNDLARSLTINPSDAFDDSGTYRMQELADVKPKDLKKYIADNWNKEVSDGWVERYNELVDTIKNDYPVYYFETKFMRPYGLDEFEKAIVPKNTPTDVMDALKKAGIDVRTYDGKEDREKVTMDAINDRDDIMFSIRTYHGTGAKFDNFDLSHAFEGEGSETFGHGVYVTNSGEIGADYAKRAKGKLSNNTSFAVNMGSPLANDWFNYFYRMVGNEGFDDAKKYVLDEFDQDIKMYSSALNGLQADDKTRKRKEATLEEMKRLREQIANTKEEDLPDMPHSYRYDVEIPDDNGHNYLYWFAEPSKEVQERILEGFYDLPSSTLDRMAQKDASFRALIYDIVKNVDKKQAIPAMVRSNTLTQKSMYDTTVMENNVGSMYRRFANWFGGADKVSDFLSSLGYTGIKYPAGTIHNGAKEGDYNYVIFNEADAKIVGNTKFSLRYSDYEKSLSDWKKRNGLPKDAKEPIKVPQQQSNESKFDYMLRVNRYLGEKALWKTAPTYEGHLLYGDTAVGYLNSELQRGSILARIAVQDSMLPIKKAQEGIMKELGLDKIGVGEDAYTAENRSHGKGKNEFEEYNQVYLQPLRKSYHAMKKLLGDSYDNVKVYMMSKHGLERNAFIAFREALKKDFTTKEKGKKDVFDANGMQKAYNDYKVDINRINNDADYAAGKIDYATYRQNDDAIRTKYAPSYPEYRYDDEGNVRDYAGLSALYADAGKFEDSDFELTAAANVKEVEKAHKAEVTALWDATNAATKKILKDSYLAGMMSKSLYDYVKGMYDYYIPLRGWDGTSADQVWDYVGGGRGAFNQAMKTAGGRKSVADDPIAYIENMAESGTLLNNKNWVKQHLLLLAENHPTSLLTVSKAWYVKSRNAQGEEIWTISSPKIPSDMTDPEKISQAISQFDNDMKTLEAMGEATQKRGNLDIEYPQTKGEEREHEVRVLRDGDEYVIYVNGDPQLAQAMNNVRAMRVRENQSGILDRSMAWLGRKMAAAYTSLSPLFIPANFTRDLTMTLASTAIREDGRYNYLLRKNFLTHWNTMPLVIKYQNGKLRQKVEDGSATETEKMFYDFMMNGGETGFVSTMEVEDFKKKIQNELKDMDRWKTNPKRIGHAIMDSIELLNRAIEDSNRFLVYMTSRQYGRPIEEAINNAKDVTLNFNRKGTGEYGWQMVRNLYLFINPAVQSLQTLGALAKEHPYKFTAVTALWLASGALVPVVNSLLLELFGGDDDKDKYWSFSKWDRRNNFIMWLPGTKDFVKVPLAQEFRGFYSVGDMIASKLMGGEKAEETWSDYAQDFMGLVVDMLPLDPTGYDGNVVVSLMPNAIRPILELAFNVDFTGKPLFNDSDYNKYDPNFTKAYVGTPDWLVRTSKLINSIGNPYPDVQQNAIDRFGNPRYNLNNPAVVDHVLSSYLGGAYTFGSQAVGVLTKALNSDSEIKVADIPLLSRFAGNPDDRPVAKKQGDAFWSMKEQQDRTSNTLSKLKKEAKVSGDYSLLEDFFKSDQYAKFKENTPRIKQYEEDKKKEKAEREGEEYKPHKTTGNDIYKNHASSTDDFEDMKMDLLWKKVGSYKTVYDGMVSIGNSQSDSYYTNHAAAIDAADEAYSLRSTINSLKKDMVTDEGKDSYSAEDMKQIRELRRQVISILENAAKTLPKPKDK